MKNLIFVDCEATGPCPGKGELTEFGAVDFASRQTFHGVLFESRPNPDNLAHSEITGPAIRDPAPRSFVDLTPCGAKDVANKLPFSVTSLSDPELSYSA